MKECKYCAAQMEDESNFCPNCGKAWEETAPEAQEAATPEEAPTPEIKEGSKARKGQTLEAKCDLLFAS